MDAQVSFTLPQGVGFDELPASLEAPSPGGDRLVRVVFVQSATGAGLSQDAYSRGYPTARPGELQLGRRDSSLPPGLLVAIICRRIGCRQNRKRRIV